MSNFTKPDINSTVGFLQYLNTVTEPTGLFNILIIVTFLVINYVALSYFGFKKAILASLFNTTVISIMMLAMGLFTGSEIIYLLIVALVGAVIFSWYQGI